VSVSRAPEFGGVVCGGKKLSLTAAHGGEGLERTTFILNVFQSVADRVSTR